MVGLNRYQEMSEDCLTLNVVAPAQPSVQPLPVMVFVHGGGYLFGSSATGVYDGAALARRGCLYISVNYRLGALGCLDLSSLSRNANPIDSNIFLRDLVLALQWVRDNVAAFGGDPSRVTIFGESAGAHAVVMLMAVPQAAGLFHAVISESPPAGLIATADEAAETARDFVALLGAEGNSGARAAKQAHPRDLVKSLERLMKARAQRAPGSSVSPRASTVTTCRCILWRR